MSVLEHLRRYGGFFLGSPAGMLYLWVCQFEKGSCCVYARLELLLQPFVAKITHRHLYSWFLIQSLMELISSLCERMCTQ